MVSDYLTRTRIEYSAIDHAGEGIGYIPHIVQGASVTMLSPLVQRTSLIDSGYQRDITGIGNIVIAAFGTEVGFEYELIFSDKYWSSLGSSGTIVVTELAGSTVFGTATDWWDANTAYILHYNVVMGGHVYCITTAGTSHATTEPIWPTDGSTIADGTAVWRDMGSISGLYLTPAVVIPNIIGASHYVLEINKAVGEMMFYGSGVPA